MLSLVMNGSTSPRKRSKRKPFDLTDRQREVLELCALNLPIEEIAARLNIKPNTVDSHLRDIFNRFGVNSRIEAAIIAIHYHQLEAAVLVAQIIAA